MSIARTAIPLHELAKTAKEKNLALISGCKSAQESADAVFNKRANGALTYFLLKALGAKTAKTKSLKTLVDIVNKSLRKVKYPQEPQIEGSPALTDMPFF